MTSHVGDAPYPSTPSSSLNPTQGAVNHPAGDEISLETFSNHTIEGTNHVALETFHAENDSFSPPPPPLATAHSFEPTTVKKELDAYLKTFDATGSDGIAPAKGQHEERIRDLQKQRKTRLLTQMMYGGIIALGMAAIVGGIVAASIFGGPLAGVLVAGIGLMAGAALVTWASYGLAEASDLPGKSDVKAAKSHLKNIEIGLEYAPKVEPDINYSFRLFLNEEFSSYETKNMPTYAALYDKKVESMRFSKEASEIEENNKQLEEEISQLKETRKVPLEKLKDLQNEQKSLKTAVREHPNSKLAVKNQIAELEVSLKGDLEPGERITQEVEKTHLERRLDELDKKVQSDQTKIMELENEIKAFNDNYKNIDSTISQKEQTLSTNQKRVADLQKNVEIWENDVKNSLETIRNINKKSTDADIDKEPEKTLTKTPFVAEKWLAQHPDISPKTWSVDLTAAPTKNSPLYMLGDYAKPPDGLSEEEKKGLETHGGSKQHRFLSPSHMENIIIDQTVYKSPIHYVLQTMIDPHDKSRTAAQEVSQTTSAEAALETAKKRASDDEYTDHAYKDILQNDDQKAAQLLKRALLVKYMQQDGSPTVLGKKLMDTQGHELIATNENGFDGWQWGAKLNADKTEITGPNVVGKILMDIRQQLLTPGFASNAQPATATPTNVPPPIPQTPPPPPPTSQEDAAPPIPQTPPPAPFLGPPTDLPPTPENYPQRTNSDAN